MTDHQRYFEFPLRHQQIKIFESLIAFADNESEKVFILKGYAGTGKTTLMGGFIKWLDEQKKSYVLLATTGRAAKILSNKTKATAITIHSHIYFFNELSEDLEKMSSLQQNANVDDKGQINLLFELKTIDSAQSPCFYNSRTYTWILNLDRSGLARRSPPKQLCFEKELCKSEARLCSEAELRRAQSPSLYNFRTFLEDLLRRSVGPCPT